MRMPMDSLRVVRYSRNILLAQLYYSRKQKLYLYTKIPNTYIVARRLSNEIINEKKV